MMSRGLLTDMERKALRGELEDANQRSTYISRVRTRLEDRVGEDVEILREHQPELFELLCDQLGLESKEKF
jgi:hypothetical protein